MTTDAKGNEAASDMPTDFGVISEQDAAQSHQDDSVAVPSTPTPDEDGNVSTMDLAEYGRELAEKPTDAQPQKGLPTDGEQQSDRLDEHPRFQQLIEERNNLRTELTTLNNTVANLQGQMQAFTAQGQGHGGQQQQEQQVNYLEMDDAELREQFAESPGEVLKAVGQQFYNQAMTDFNRNIQQGQTRTAVETTFANFEKDNPEFTTAWNDGSIKQFMDENPGHNAISAFMTMTHADNVAKIKADARKEVITEIKTKGNINSLGPGPNRNPVGIANTDDMLRNPDAYGGSEAVLYKRYLARQGK